MLSTPFMTQFLETGLLFAALFLLAATLNIVAEKTGFFGRTRSARIQSFLFVYSLAIVTSASLTQAYWEIAFLTFASLSLLSGARFWMRSYSLGAQIWLASLIQMMLIGTIWGILFTLSLHLPYSLLIAIFLAFALATILAPLGFGKLWLQIALFGRERWQRPRKPFEKLSPNYLPMVSIHVPCYAEPPDVVIETLDALSRLDYPNYEVIVIDNNTKDPNLWKPLQHHCEKLGERFRFFHVDPLSGAKAGALNFILPHSAVNAELVACIDADYVAEPDFLKRLVGFFEDTNIGFVQTSHDYRLWENRVYQKACYWEYMPTYKQLLPTLSEWSSAYTVGTMCIIRRKALEDAGGWAEWCLTEDSELAVRIHALGYKSVAVSDTFGRGLIPETYSGYKKQRFRWTAGPGQQLKRHYRLLLSNFFSKSAPMSTTQKFFELIHCTEGFQFVLGFVAWLLMPIALVLMIHFDQPIVLPSVLWTVLISTLVSNWILRWFEFRMLGATIKDMLWAQLASISLLHTREIASFAGLFSRKPLAWNRTSKFKALPSGLNALKSSFWEFTRACISIAIATFGFIHTDLGEPSIALAASAFMMLTGISYLTSPFMAYLGERDIVLQSKQQVALSKKQVFES